MEAAARRSSKVGHERMLVVEDAAHKQARVRAEEPADAAVAQRDLVLGGHEVLPGSALQPDLADDLRLMVPPTVAQPLGASHELRLSGQAK